MRIDYEYGATDTIREPVPEAPTTGSSSSSEDEDRGESSRPLYHVPLKSTQTGTQTPEPKYFSTPTKDYSARVGAYQRENTPLTLPTLGYDDSPDSSVSPPPRYIQTQDADDVRLAINFQTMQYSTPLPDPTTSNKTEVLLQTFGPKLVLEVMGGAGAVWGFSEAIGLRTSATNWFWRPITLVAGILFFSRWLGQLLEFRKQYDRQARRRMQDETVQALLMREDV